MLSKSDNIIYVVRFGLQGDLWVSPNHWPHAGWAPVLAMFPQIRCLWCGAAFSRGNRDACCLFVSRMSPWPVLCSQRKCCWGGFCKGGAGVTNHLLRRRFSDRWVCGGDGYSRRASMVLVRGVLSYCAWGGFSLGIASGPDGQSKAPSDDLTGFPPYLLTGNHLGNFK